MSCGVGHRCGLDRSCCGCGRLAAVALIWPLAREPPYATGTVLERPKKKKFFLFALTRANVRCVEQNKSNIENKERKVSQEDTIVSINVKIK